ncbi:hypothetical protein AAGW05_03155 [Arthrobacter sp. LAPM80]|uniref:hypothetical protein n=1 Tax=Arthrobacter sp. LAPM80 TaxID=3141788 RepID=UPI00398B35A7
MATIASETSQYLLWGTARDIGVGVCLYINADSAETIKLTVLGAFAAFSAVIFGYAGPGIAHKLTGTAKVRKPMKIIAKLCEFAGLALTIYGIWQLGRDYTGMAVTGAASVVGFMLVWAVIIYGVPEYWRRRKLAVATRQVSVAQRPAAEALAIHPTECRCSRALTGWEVAGVTAALLVFIAVTSRLAPARNAESSATVVRHD